MLSLQGLPDPMTLDNTQTSPVLPVVRGVELHLLIEFLRFLRSSTDDLDCTVLSQQKTHHKQLKIITGQGRYSREVLQVRSHQNRGAVNNSCLRQHTEGQAPSDTVVGSVVSV